MKHHRPRLLFLLAVLCLAVCLLAGCAARAATADPDADLPPSSSAVTTTRPSTT